MLIMKKGMPVNSGKTTEALKKVVELLSNNQTVLFVSNELTHESICKRITELSNNESIINECFTYVGGDSKEDLEKLLSDIKSDESTSSVLKNSSIVVDVGKDVSDLKCDQDLYVYYQIPRENNSR